MPSAVIVVFAVLLLLYIIFFPLTKVLERDLCGTTCHRAPDIPYTPEEAHDVWRRRMNCDAAYCDAKRQALYVLDEDRRAAFTERPQLARVWR